MFEGVRQSTRYTYSSNSNDTAVIGRRSYTSTLYQIQEDFNQHFSSVDIKVRFITSYNYEIDDKPDKIFSSIMGSFYYSSNRVPALCEVNIFDWRESTAFVSKTDYFLMRRTFTSSNTLFTSNTYQYLDSLSNGYRGSNSVRYLDSATIRYTYNSSNTFETNYWGACRTSTVKQGYYEIKTNGNSTYGCITERFINTGMSYYNTSHRITGGDNCFAAGFYSTLTLYKVKTSNESVPQPYSNSSYRDPVTGFLCTTSIRYNEGSFFGVNTNTSYNKYQTGGGYISISGNNEWDMAASYPMSDCYEISARYKIGNGEITSKPAEELYVWRTYQRYTITYYKETYTY